MPRIESNLDQLEAWEPLDWGQEGGISVTLLGPREGLKGPSIGTCREADWSPYWDQLGGLRAANRARRGVDRSLDWSQLGGFRASQLDPRRILIGRSIGPPIEIGGLGWTLPGSFYSDQVQKGFDPSHK